MSQATALQQSLSGEAGDEFNRGCRARGRKRTHIQQFVKLWLCPLSYPGTTGNVRAPISRGKSVDYPRFGGRTDRLRP